MGTKEKIKEAAIRLFAEHGYLGMTIKEIAKEVGIKPPSVYSFFESKREIFLEIYDEMLGDHLDTVASKVNRQKSAKAQLYDMVRSAIDYQYKTILKNKIIIRLIVFPPDSLEEDILKKFEQMELTEREWMIQILEHGIEQGEVRQGNTERMAKTLQCIMDGLFWEMQRLKPEEVYQRVEEVFSQYWASIEKRSC